MIIRVLVGTLVGGITMILLGWLIFGFLLAEFFRNSMINYPGLVKDPPDIIPLVLFNFAYAWLIAFVFEYWAKIRDFVSGLKAGALIILPVIFGINMQYQAFMNIITGLTPVIADVLLTTLVGAIVGGVIGFTLGKLAGNETPEMA